MAVNPIEARAGETGTCAECGMTFEQQPGITAGNFCSTCWELRNIRVAQLYAKWSWRRRLEENPVLAFLALIVMLIGSSFVQPFWP